MENATDIDIMLRVKSGDVDKLSLLFDRYKQRLFSYFYRLTLNAHHSEDLVQNVFVRILQYRHRYSERGPFSCWLYRIAHNVFIDHVRKNNRYQPTEDFSDFDILDEREQDDQFIRNEQLQLLEKAMHLLSPDKREILVLSKYQQMRYKEIVKILGLSEANVKIKVFRALNDLKEIYVKLEDMSYEEK